VLRAQKEGEEFLQGLPHPTDSYNSQNCSDLEEAKETGRVGSLPLPPVRNHLVRSEMSQEMGSVSGELRSTDAPTPPAGCSP